MKHWKWSLGTGHWAVEPGNETLGSGAWEQDTGQWSLGMRHWAVEPGNETLEVEPGNRTLGSGAWE